MAAQTFAATVAQTPVAVLSGQGFFVPGTTQIVVSNQGANAVFLGGPDVTTSTGVMLAAGALLPIPTWSGADLWCVATTGSNLVVVGVL